MEMNLETEIKKEYKNFENVFDQFGNVFYTIISSVGTWLLAFTTTMGFMSICLILTYDGSSISFTELKLFFTGMVIISAVIVTVGMGFDLPNKFRSMFETNDKDRVGSDHNNESSLKTQIKITDDLLLSYGIISQEEINKRIKKSKFASK